MINGYKHSIKRICCCYCCIYSCHWKIYRNWSEIKDVLLTWFLFYRFIPGKSYCFVFWPSDIYYMYFMIAVCFCGPLSIMTFSYINIFMLRRRVQQRLERNRNSLANDNNRRSTQGTRVSLRMIAEEKKFTNTLIMVVACFILCWLPFVVTMFFDVYERTPLPRQVDFLSLLLGYLNSMCNPIFYGLRNRKMKRGFIDLYEQCFPALRCCKRLPAIQLNVSATSNYGASYTPGDAVPDETPQPRNSNSHCQKQNTMANTQQ